MAKSIEGRVNIVLYEMTFSAECANVDSGNSWADSSRQWCGQRNLKRKNAAYAQGEKFLECFSDISL